MGPLGGGRPLVFNAAQLRAMYRDTAMLVVGNSVVGRHFETLRHMLQGARYNDTRITDHWWAGELVHYSSSQFAHVWAYGERFSGSKALCVFDDAPNQCPTTREHLRGHGHLSFAYRSFAVRASEMGWRKHLVVVGGTQWRLMSDAWNETAMGERIDTIIIPRLRSLTEECVAPTCRILVWGELPCKGFNVESSFCGLSRCIRGSKCDGACQREVLTAYNALLSARLGQEFGNAILFLDLSPVVEHNLLATETTLVHWTDRLGPLAEGGQ
jgi:hypothetical protein